MNHSVPGMSVPSAPSLNHRREDEMMELLWQNNPSVGVYPLDQLSFTKSPSSNSIDTVTPPAQPQNPSLGVANNNLFTPEDEMAAWLHYPIDEFYSEPVLKNPTLEALPSVTIQTARNSAPVLQLSTAALEMRNFQLFSRMANNNLPALERLRSGFTVVGSNDTPPTSNYNIGPELNVEASAVAPLCPSSEPLVTNTSTAVVPGVGENINIGECGVEGGMASPSSNSATNSATANVSTSDASARTTSGEAVCQKRKTREDDEVVAATTTGMASKPHIEDLELESDDEKKQSRGSTGTKRTRAAEVHNLSERRRRDRINEKMRALQELIPRCNKTDKASILDDAVEYLKSLQMQVQMMSMGSGMMPSMMYPGMQQQYMPLMGMGVDMGMPRPMMLCPSTMPAPALPNPGQNITLPVVPRLLVPPFAMPSIQPSNPVDSISNLYAPQISVIHFPTVTDPYYQQFLAYQQMRTQMQQTQGVLNRTLAQPVSNKSARRRTEGDNEEDAQ